MLWNVGCFPGNHFLFFTKKLKPFSVGIYHVWMKFIWFVGTYCISNTWSRSIDELQCIPATTIVTVGGYGQVWIFSDCKIKPLTLKLFLILCEVLLNELTINGGPHKNLIFENRSPFLYLLDSLRW